MKKKIEFETNLENLEEQELYPEPEEAVEDLVEETIEEPVEEEIAPVTEDDVRIGVVTPVNGLNIREQPSIYAPVLEVLSKDSIVVIKDEEKDTDGIAWLKVITEFVAPGYCMKEFVEEQL